MIPFTAGVNPTSWTLNTLMDFPTHPLSMGGSSTDINYSVHNSTDAVVIKFWGQGLESCHVYVELWDTGLTYSTPFPTATLDPYLNSASKPAVGSFTSRAYITPLADASYACTTAFFGGLVPGKVYMFRPVLFRNTSGTICAEPGEVRSDYSIQESSDNKFIPNLSPSTISTIYNDSDYSSGGSAQGFSFITTQEYNKLLNPRISTGSNFIAINWEGVLIDPRYNVDTVSVMVVPFSNNFKKGLMPIEGNNSYGESPDPTGFDGMRWLGNTLLSDSIGGFYRTLDYWLYSDISDPDTPPAPGTTGTYKSVYLGWDERLIKVVPKSTPLEYYPQYLGGSILIAGLVPETEYLVFVRATSIDSSGTWTYFNPIKNAFVTRNNYPGNTGSGVLTKTTTQKSPDSLLESLSNLLNVFVREKSFTSGMLNSYKYDILTRKLSRLTEIVGVLEFLRIGGVGNEEAKEARADTLKLNDVSVDALKSFLDSNPFYQSISGMTATQKSELDTLSLKTASVIDSDVDTEYAALITELEAEKTAILTEIGWQEVSGEFVPLDTPGTNTVQYFVNLYEDRYETKTKDVSDTERAIEQTRLYSSGDLLSGVT